MHFRDSVGMAPRARRSQSPARPSCRDSRPAGAARPQRSRPHQQYVLWRHLSRQTKSSLIHLLDRFVAEGSSQQFALPPGRGASRGTATKPSGSLAGRQALRRTLEEPVLPDREVSADVTAVQTPLGPADVMRLIVEGGVLIEVGPGPLVAVGGVGTSRIRNLIARLSGRSLQHSLRERRTATCGVTLNIRSCSGSPAVASPNADGRSPAVSRQVCGASGSGSSPNPHRHPSSKRMTRTPPGPGTPTSRRASPR